MEAEEALAVAHEERSLSNLARPERVVPRKDSREALRPALTLIAAGGGRKMKKEQEVRTLDVESRAER